MTAAAALAILSTKPAVPEAAGLSATDSLRGFGSKESSRVLFCDRYSHSAPTDRIPAGQEMDSGTAESWS